MLKSERSFVFLIGGYQKGDPETFNINSLVEKHRITSIRLYEDIVPAWVVCSKVVHLLEEFF